MINALHNLPDWGTGAATAGLAWFATCHVWLTPRVIEAEANTALPVCMERLDAQQDQYLSQLHDQKSREREHRVEDLRRTIRSKTSHLREIETDMALYQTTVDSVADIPFQIFPDLSDALPKPEELQAIRDEISEAQSKLSALPEISLPRAPDSELLSTCTCAVFTSMNTKRVDYSISLASFRLISPASIENTKREIGDALRFDACGTPSWESLS